MRYLWVKFESMFVAVIVVRSMCQFVGRETKYKYVSPSSLWLSSLLLGPCHTWQLSYRSHFWKAYFYGFFLSVRIECWHTNFDAKVYCKQQLQCIVATVGTLSWWVDYILRESQTMQNVLWSRASVWLSVCVSVCPQPYAHTTARTQMLLGGVVEAAP